MMKRIAILLFFIITGLLGFFLFKNYQTKTKTQKTPNKKITAANNKIKKTDISSTSIFVPYWSLDEQSTLLNDYDILIYFGIAASRYGIDIQEAGFKGIPAFVEVSEGKKKFLTLRMINDDVNVFVLGNEDAQEKIIRETLGIIEQNKFDGVVLDLEISNILNKDTQRQIDAFVHKFYTVINENYKSLFLTIYGDSVFRRRPYNLSYLGKNSDGIFIMAYDFHTMIFDFIQVVPKEKITVIFGMFGYDWLVDEKKRPIRQAEALSLNEIKKKFLSDTTLTPIVTNFV